MNTRDYTNIAKLGKNFDNIQIPAHIPTPTKEDYVVGYILRYFLQKSTDRNSIIYEVNKNVSSKLRQNPFYVVTSLKWRLTGTSDEIRKSNSASIKIASKDIPNIGLYLPNLLQFHKK